MKKYLYQDLYNLEDKHWWHITKRKLCIELIYKYNKKKIPTICDIGCGTGRNIEEFAQLGTVWGVDNSKLAIVFCKNKRGLINIHHANIHKTVFPSNKFDIITMLDVLEHTNDKLAIREVSRLLKPKGILLITVPAYPWLWSKWDEVLFHKRRYVKKSLLNLLEIQGFNILKISYMYPVLIIPALVIRTIKSIMNQEFYKSDFTISFPGANWMLIKISNFELQLMRKIDIPFGTSLICVAQKR